MTFIALTAATAHAQVEGDAGFSLLSAQLYERSLQRGIDQAGNPELLRRYNERPRPLDPFRIDWGCAEAGAAAGCRPRGRELDVRIPNRYGKTMHGHFSVPLGAAEERQPAIIFLTGDRSSEEGYRGLQQGLAEAGYVVLGLNVQGDERAEAAPADPDPDTPENEHPDCAPGWWQEPQEMGIRETGSCPGQYQAPEKFEQTALRVAGHNEDFSTLEAGYTATAARKTFGALDGVAYLLSNANPFRDLIDEERVGIIGHSMGSHGALLAANGDPARRFAAAVSLDGGGLITPYASPTVPTMFQQAEEQDYGPHRVAPVSDSRATHKNARMFARAGVPTMLVAFAGSTHQEFNFIEPGGQQMPIGLNASRDGERLSLHYALAWFDRWLGRGKTRKAARPRLLAATYDGRADASSIGQGHWDGQRNVPPTIGGEPARHHLSPLYESWAFFDGLQCTNLRERVGRCDPSLRP